MCSFEDLEVRLRFFRCLIYRDVIFQAGQTSIDEDLTQLSMVSFVVFVEEIEKLRAERDHYRVQSWP